MPDLRRGKAHRSNQRRGDDIALVDTEAVLQDLKAAVREKPSFGRRELSDLILDLEVKHRKDEPLLERALRTYIDEVREIIGPPD